MRIIAGEARGRRIDAPSGKNTRPTLDRIRENLFNMIQQDVPDSRVLDLFAGSGALSLEALSRGASFAVMADHDRNACSTIRSNIQKLDYGERTSLLFCDWRQAVDKLRREQERFDIVFLDPPYAMNQTGDVFHSLLPLVDADSLIILEHEAGKAAGASPEFRCVKQKSWGYCAVSLFRVLNECIQKAED